ncbi:MAG: AmmeMemoRadiSam system radical SAM enzyme [Desulfuromonadaceae bacterium]|nr:AmmeMemoRadiSam system radical SAM enzyme [Desulfuromonadaceae bacterium]
MKEALFWEAEADQRVQCRLCPHGCHIQAGQRGRCRVRENRDGTLMSLNYGRVVATHVDPVEKKPLFHYAPGSRCFSFAAMGCNFSCRHCQNATISQVRGRIDGDRLMPQHLVAMAEDMRCHSIAYTYTEPTVFYEMVYETAQLASARGIDNLLVSNGFIEEQPLRQVIPFLTAANIDLKSFREDVYRSLCGGRLEPVLQTLRRLREAEVWLEVTTLVIPGYNDDEQQLAALTEFIARELGPDTPWHVSAFFPTYRLTDVPPTPVATLKKARSIGLAAGLHYVYLGNVPGEAETTHCPQCGQAVIVRAGYRLQELSVVDGMCSSCETPIAGRLLH